MAAPRPHAGVGAALRHRRPSPAAAAAAAAASPAVKPGAGDPDPQPVRPACHGLPVQPRDAQHRHGASPRFAALAFSQQFSVFDAKNAAAATSPFHGFYVLFWLAVALFVFKISADGWRHHGSPLGSSDILKTMFHRDVALLLLSDGVMCALTGVSWLIQRAVLRGYLDWDGWGWIVQNVWQTAFFAAVVGWPLVRDWPWTHTVFFVMHGLVMLMKQHSYAFYNGYLSVVYLRRRSLLSRLCRLYPAGPALDVAQDVAPSGLDGTSQPLDAEQARLLGRALRSEADALADELRGTAKDDSRAYPNNLGFVSHFAWIPLPTVVYELDYPRSDSISWIYVAEKVVAMVGVLFAMIQISQYSIYPVVMRTVEMRETGMPLSARVREFPWLLGDLIFPFTMEWLLVWYLIWETILNILAELTYFADRSFYGPWWNSVSWDQFARDWNRPVHVFLLRHVYHGSISSMRVGKHAATLITFFSACVHELMMLCLFKKLRCYLLVMQMCQLPLVSLSRTRWLRNRKTLGNFLFWLAIFICPSVLCSLYLVL